MYQTPSQINRLFLGLALFTLFSNWWFNRPAASTPEPQVIVMPTLPVPIEVPVVDHDACVELLAAEVQQPSTNCFACHPAQGSDSASGMGEGSITDPGIFVVPRQELPVMTF